MEQKTKFTFIFKLKHKTTKKLQAIRSYFLTQRHLQRERTHFSPGKFV